MEIKGKLEIIVKAMDVPILIIETEGKDNEVDVGTVKELRGHYKKLIDLVMHLLGQVKDGVK